jgi:hypothetical protein
MHLKSKHVFNTLIKFTEVLSHFQIFKCLQLQENAHSPGEFGKQNGKKGRKEKLGSALCKDLYVAVR